MSPPELAQSGDESALGRHFSAFIRRLSSTTQVCCPTRICLDSSNSEFRYQDYEGLDYYLLPGVTSTAKPRVDAQGDVLGRGPVQGGIRERLWADQDKPPAILTPSRLYIVDRLGSLFEKAIARLQAAERFGLSSEGGLLGRASPLAFLLLATKEDVFMFDVQELGVEGWDDGLRRVLEEPNLLKIIHDCRQLSDCLWHQHNVRLTGVYDTMAGDMVYISTNLLFGLLPRYTRSQAHLVRDYLGVQDEEIAFPRYRRAGLAEEQEVWRQRPLADHLLLLAARGDLCLPILLCQLKCLARCSVSPCPLCFHQSSQSTTLSSGRGSSQLSGSSHAC